MMNKLAKWLLGRTFTVLVMGEEGSGKTSFIQRLRYPSGSETLPTKSPNAISYMGETVEYPVDTEWWFREMTAAASMRDFQPMVQCSLSSDTIVLWIHDCQKEPTLDPVVFAAFLQDMVDAGCRYFWVALNKQDSQLVSKEVVDDLRQSYEAVLWKFRDKFLGKILGRGSRVSSGTGDGVFDILDELHTAVGREKIQSGIPELLPQSAHDKTSSNSATVYEDGPQTIIETAIAEDTTDPDTFWAQFQAGILKIWNHYTYLKAGYFLILSSGETEPAISTAQTYTTHLTRLLKFNPGLIHKTHDADHLKQTVTTFWIVQLEHAIREYRQATMSPDLPSRSEFPQILRHSPHLMNRTLWDQYYSYNAIHSYPHAQWKASDQKPLSLATNFRCDPAMLPVPAKGEDRLLRYAFCVVRYIERSNAPRGETVTLALRTLEKSTLHLRTLDSTIPVYSETQAYFWIQILHAALRSLSLSRGASASKEYTFEEICDMFQLNATSWKEYYSERTWDSIATRMQFVLPDIKPLPNVFAPVKVPLHETSEKQGGNWEDAKLPSTEELSFLAATVIQEAKVVKAELPITSHAGLLFYLFTTLTPRPKSKKSPESSPSCDFDALTLGQAAQGIFTDLSSPAAGALVSAATHRNFWIQQVGVAMLHWAREGQINFDGDGNSTFAAFIASNTHLAFRELPAIYYSAAVWTGSGSKRREAIVQGDRRGLVTIGAGAGLGLGLGEVNGIEIEAGWVAV